MSEQQLDLATSWRILRRQKTLVAVAVALGVSCGVAYAMVRPPMLTSQAEVALGSSQNVATQVVVASSTPVLTLAQQHLAPTMSLPTLRARVRTKSLAPTIISISAEGVTAAQAEDVANAVANSYVGFIASTDSPGLRTSAAVLQPATSGTGRSLADRLILAGLLGALLGLLVGTILALATHRKDRRLRERDEIAGSIGIPVLMSISAMRASGTRDWAGLLEGYEPGDVDAWRLRMALYKLGLTEFGGTDLSVEADGADISASGNYSLAVLSLSCDPKALALGPQLAVFAASHGIPTVLLVGPQQDLNGTATLRAACSTLRPSRRLRTIVSNRHHPEVPLDTRLTVAVAVVDSENPEVGRTMRTTATVLSVSAGAVTAPQLARVAASTAALGRDLVGLLVADPDPDDRTTGRIAELAPLVQRKTWIRVGDMPRGIGITVTGQ
jgi:capsular polysaccharide biosynthesis protein